MIVMNEVKVKYETLDSQLEDKLRNIKYNGKVHVVIDLKEVYRKAYRPRAIEEMSQQMIIELTVDVINTIAHYRNYFYKYGKKSQFHLLYSSEESEEMKNLFPNYKREAYDKSFHDSEKEIANEVIKSATELLVEIVPRISNCIYIDTSKYDEFVYTKYIKSKVKDNQLMFILTDDAMFTQLLSENVSIIDMKGENSTVVTPENYAEHYFAYKNVIPVNLSSSIIAIGGVGRYGLNRTENVGTYHAARVIHKYYKEGLILNSNYSEFPLKKENLDTTNKTEERIHDNLDLIKENYEVVTADRVYYRNTDYISVDFLVQRRVQPKSYFLDLNAKIFQDYYINLNMLFQGEDGYDFR